MNCLIVIPSYQDLANYSYMFPTGPGYVSAAMKQTAGLQVFTLNLNHQEGDEAEALRSAIRRHDIKIVLAGGLYFDYPNIKKILATAKTLDRKIHTVAGGLLVTGDPETAMTALEYADYGLIGEGEISAPALCLALKNGDPPEQVEGLIYKQDGRYVRSAPRTDYPPLESLPWCDYEGLGLDFYLDHSLISAGVSSIISSLPARTAPVIASRSCPYHCTFCGHPEGRYRERPLDHFFAELDYLVDRFKLEYITLCDDLLGRTEERLAEFCRRLPDYKLTGWSCALRIDQLTPAKLEMLKDSGFKTLSLGLESAHDDVLRSMRKQMTVKQMTAGLEMIRRAGLKMVGNFIFGDTAETYQTSLATLDWWQKHPQYSIVLVPIRCYPGSELYRRAVSDGVIADPVEFLKEGCPVVNASRMTAEEFEDIIYRRIPALMQQQRITYPLFSKWVIKDRQTAKHAVDLEAQCQACGRTSLYRHIDIYRIPWLACHHCETRNRFPEPLELIGAEAISRGLKALLSEWGAIAFWGIGAIFRRVIEPSLIEDPDIHLLDASAGGRYGSKPIEPPEAILEHGIGLVITMPDFSPNQALIAAEARERYGVKKTISYSDLLLGRPGEEA